GYFIKNRVARLPRLYARPPHDPQAGLWIGNQYPESGVSRSGL
ncbi:MAG: hypothetical protein AVDCRST_MAG56-7511, partial [uncultured Cytophagales bacterium]